MENERKIINAQITNTMLGREDHGIMTFMIFVRCDDFGCGIGGYALDVKPKQEGDSIYSPKAMEVLSKILETVGVNKWEDLKGKYIRVVDEGHNSAINEIGNLMEDKWLNFKDFFSHE